LDARAESPEGPQEPGRPQRPQPASTEYPPAPGGVPEAFRRFLADWLFSPLDGVRLGDWVRLLGRRDLLVPPIYWPRTAFTTGMAVLNSVLSRWDRRRENEWRTLSVRAPVFVLGHHRSGTTHLWNILSRDPRFAFPSVLQAVFPHSFLTFEPAIRGLAHRLSIRKRPQDNVAIEPDSPIEEERALCTSTFLSIQMARHFPSRRDLFTDHLTLRTATAAERQRWMAAFDQFARKLLVRHGPDRTLLFKSPDHTAKVALILELFPDARFVHIHRDPYTVFASTRKMERRTQPIYAYQRWDDEDLDAFILWRYRAMYDAYLQDRSRIPKGRLVEISFKQLEEAPLETVASIYNGLGLELEPRARESMEDYLLSVSGYRKNVHPELSEDVLERVAERWRPMFEAWGYPR